MHYLETALRNVFEYFYIISNSYGISIIFLSIAVTGFLTPFYYLTGILEKREKNTRERLDPFIERINKIKDPQIRHKHMQKLYKSFKYSPIYSLRSLSSLLIQIPFFIAAYEMLKHFEGLRGVSFLFINDLGEPDKILGGVNLLPVMMTLINFAAAIFMTWNAGSVSRETEKERKQSYIIAVFFLVLLYTSPAGLVLYWTFNNLINMIRYFIIWNKENSVSEIAQAVGKKIKGFINKDELSVFLLFCALYFSINLFSFGNFDKSNVPILYGALILSYAACILKACGYIHSNIKQDKHFKSRIILIALLLFLIPNRVYLDEKLYYLLSVLLFFLICNKWHFKKYLFKEYAQSSGFCMVAVLFPALIYVNPNQMYFVGNDIIIYLAILIFFAALLPVISSFFSSLPLREITDLSVSFILSAMFLPLIRTMVKFTGDISVDFIILFAFVFFVLNLIKRYRKILIIFLLCGAAYSPFSAFALKSASQDDNVVNIDVKDQIVEAVPEELLNMDMKDTPSIYLFMHDAFPRKDLAQVLNIDYEEVEEILKEYDFTIYDVYSITDNTLGTMSSIFNISDKSALVMSTISFTDVNNNHPSVSILWEKIMSGENFTDILLHSKGYSIWLEGSLVDYQSQDVDSVMRVMNKYGFMPQVLLGIMQGYLNSTMLKYYSDYPAMVTAKFASKQNNKDKIFAWGHTGPDHSTLQGHGSAEEQRRWKPRYYNSIKDMKKELELTLRNNPDAIVIIMSDHGPVLLDDAVRLYSSLDAKEISAMHFRDTFGAFMAIHWPDKKRASKYDKEFTIVQDLFPIVFAYLYDSPIPLKYKIKNTEVEIRGRRFDKGELL